MPVGLLNPWLLLAVLCAILGAAGGGYRKGVSDSEAEQKTKEALIAEASEKAQLATAEVISKITVTNTTIRQKVERETREMPVYRDCRNSDVGMRLLNSALSGAQGDAAGAVKLPRISGGAD